MAPSSIEDDTEMARRWRAAINEAFFQSRARHFRQKGIPFKDITSRNGTASTENTFGDKEPELNIQVNFSPILLHEHIENQQSFRAPYMQLFGCFKNLH